MNRLILVILGIFGIVHSIYAQEIIIVDSVEKIDACIEFSKELLYSNSSSGRSKSIEDYKTIEYQRLHSSLIEAQEKFFKLEVDDAEKIFDSILQQLTNVTIIGGGLNEVYNLFEQAISYKVLILLSKKETERAKAFLKDYVSIFSSIYYDNKKIHPSLKGFLSANLDNTKSLCKKDEYTSLVLKKSFSAATNILFDGLRTIPDTFYDGRHILILGRERDQYRVIIQDFSAKISSPIYIGDYKNKRVYIASTDDGFEQAKQMHYGNELVFCREGRNGLISSDGKLLSKEEALAGKIKVEIIKAEEVDEKGDKKNLWWLYGAGGIIAVAIVTSIIILNSDNKGKDDFRDIIQVK